ncbi:hypothetical protein BGW37DRAFT_466742 [Umbelopsis sp. PMI_123]|nr:hypothetical protein BGW37DRAFT_466742 [Umbelopsis sp. PMI_123]
MCSWVLRISQMRKLQLILKLQRWILVAHRYSLLLTALVNQDIKYEYYSMTGSKRRNQKLQQKKEAGILKIEESWQTGKTCNIRQYQSYVAPLLNNFDELSKFYDISRGKMRFENFQSVQRSREEMANMLVNGGKKYSKSRRKNTQKIRRLRGDIEKPKN